jgi:hypothetical protein
VPRHLFERQGVKKVYQILNIPKPENLPAKRAGETKYPLASMKVGDSFVVPFSEMRDGETSEKFRGRVYKSCREFARRNSKEDEKMEFTAVVMPEDDKQEPSRYAQGDIVVWRDK